MAQETRFRIDIVADQDVDLPVLGTIRDQIRIVHDEAIAAADKRFVQEFSLAASAATSFDLSGALTDLRGNAAVFTTVKLAIIIHDSDSEASSISLSGNIGGVLFSTEPIPPGGHVSRGGNTSVVNSSKDTLTVTNDDGAEIATGKIVITGG